MMIPQSNHCFKDRNNVHQCTVYDNSPSSSSSTASISTNGLIAEYVSLGNDGAYAVHFSGGVAYWYPSYTVENVVSTTAIFEIRGFQHIPPSQQFKKYRRRLDLQQ